MCEIPRWLVVGEVNETFVCGICDGLLREPRHVSSCEHILCQVCLAAALIKEACCPICKQPVDESEPLDGFRPFEAMVNSTVVRCPSSTAERGGVGGTISKETATSREDSGSSAPIRSSVQAPGVNEVAVDGGSCAGPRASGTGGSGLSSSPFDGVHVGAPSNILKSCSGHLSGRSAAKLARSCTAGHLDKPLMNRTVPM